MSELQRGPVRIPLAARRPRDVDVYGGPGDGERAQPNIFAVIWRRRWIVVICVLLALVGGFVYNAKATPIYSSASTIYVQDNVLKIMNDPMGGGGRSTGYLFTQCQLLTSTAILSEAIKKPEVAEASCLRGVDNPVGFLKSVVTAVPDKMGDLIYVTAETVNPQDAAVLVNAVVEAYIDYQGSQHKSSAVEVLRIYQKEIAKHENDLKTSQDAMLALKRASPDLAFQTEKGSLALNRLGDLSNKLSDAQQQMLDVKMAVAESVAVKDDPAALKWLMEKFQISTDADAGFDPTVMAEYRQSRSKLNDLIDSRLGPKNDLVVQATKQAGRAQSELAQASHDAAGSYNQLLQQSLKIASTKVEGLQAALDAARTSAIDLTFKQAEYIQLQQNAERTMRSIDLLDSRIKDVNVNEDVGSLTVSVLETAKANAMPVRPVKSKTLGMALVAGLMSGVGLAMLRDLLDQRLRSADEITALLDLPILGVVPHMLGKAKLSQRGRMVQHQPRSNPAEAYRTIRTAIFFGLAEGQAKTVLFTSPSPGDGKSTCVSNLALSFAQSERRTLLIDADCRRPTQDRIYEVRGGVGLSEVLSGQTTFAEAVRKTDMDKLDILPCGSIPHNPAELLDSQALLDLLAEVGGRYDHILIDSPPIIPVTDARILAASCDVTVLVLRADRSTRRLAEHARDAIQSVGANLLGVVVNDVPRGKNGYGYDYYGTGHYGYKSIANGQAKANGSANNTANSTANGDHAAAGAMAVPQRTIDG